MVVIASLCPAVANSKQTCLFLVNVPSRSRLQRNSWAHPSLSPALSLSKFRWSQRLRNQTWTAALFMLHGAATATLSPFPPVWYAALLCHVLCAVSKYHGGQPTPRLSQIAFLLFPFISNTLQVTTCLAIVGQSWAEHLRLFFVSLWCCFKGLSPIISSLGWEAWKDQTSKSCCGMYGQAAFSLAKVLPKDSP